MTLLEIFRRKKWITEKEHRALEQEGLEITKMIKGLINAIGGNG
jgi:hypothetical protein